MHVLDALVEVRLVEADQVGEVDLEPSQAAGGQGLRLVEEEQTATEIVADVAQVGRRVVLGGPVPVQL